LIVCKNFSPRSTWAVCCFTLLTFGLYLAHYINNQTKIVNSKLENSEKISNLIIKIIFISSYGMVSLLILHIIFIVLEYELYDSITLFKDIFYYISWITTIIWGFIIKNRMNNILDYQKNDKMWFHTFWTLLFSAYYFNYKVNCIFIDIVLKE